MVKYALAFCAGVICMLALPAVAYWYYFVRGNNTGWPS